MAIDKGEPIILVEVFEDLEAIPVDLHPFLQLLVLHQPDHLINRQCRIHGLGNSDKLVPEIRPICRSTVKLPAGSLGKRGHQVLLLLSLLLLLLVGDVELVVFRQADVLAAFHLLVEELVIAARSRGVPEMLLRHLQHLVQFCPLGLVFCRIWVSHHGLQNLSTPLHLKSDGVCRVVTSQLASSGGGANHVQSLL